MALLIRPATQSDIPYLYKICIETGDSGKDASALFHDPWLLGQYYAAPYLFHDISLCFIAEENLVPKGYILGTADTAAFNRWFETEWLPPLRRRYPAPASAPEPAVTAVPASAPAPLFRSETERALIATIHNPVTAPDPAFKPWIAEHPAHLHIDLLPDLQGKGCGRTLLETLLAALAARACPGIHLGVSGTNTGAIGFYKKTGFTVLEEEEWGLIMGKRISSGASPDR